MNKRIFALVLSVCMALSLLTGCGSSSSGDSSVSGDASTAVSAEIPAEALEDVVSYLTDGALTSDTVVMTVGGTDVTADYYLYQLAYSANMMNLTYQYYYGTDIDLSMEVSEGQTAAQYVQNAADSTVKGYFALEQQAAEMGVALTDEEQESIDSYQFSSDANDLLYYSTTASAMTHLYQQYSLSSSLQELLYGEGGELAPTEETIQDYISSNGLYNCRYILCQVSEDATEEEDAAAKQKCQDIYDELSQLEGEELLAKFQEYQAENPDGNTDEFSFNDSSSLTDGFREKLAELEIGQLGMTDKTGYGYFTLLRLDVDTDSVKEDYISSSYAAQMSEWGEAAECTTTEAYDKIDPLSFYENLTALQSTIDAYEAAQTAAESSAE